MPRAASRATRSSKIAASFGRALPPLETLSGRSGFREAYQCFECVPAGVALPKMPDAAFADMLGPCRHQDGLSALSARIAKRHRSIMPEAVGSQFHLASSPQARSL